MFAKSDKECESCGRHWDSGFMLEFHHIIPLSAGGKNVEGNAQFLCRTCHLKAHFKLFDLAKAKGNKKQMNANAFAIRKLKERIRTKTIYQYGKEPS